ncbi:membralin [Anaeramoeba flamelloides]|uniref:Membralin n=1 Tax=Anaeramoeba flamelloides TaxID=1746091 RepID=A0AAV8A909_9EUKA|nr:membralin [Anaeramoeba flamelloides]
MNNQTPQQANTTTMVIHPDTILALQHFKFVKLLNKDFFKYILLTISILCLTGSVLFFVFSLNLHQIYVSSSTVSTSCLRRSAANGDLYSADLVHILIYNEEKQHQHQQHQNEENNFNMNTESQKKKDPIMENKQLKTSLVEDIFQQLSHNSNNSTNLVIAYIDELFKESFLKSNPKTNLNQNGFQQNKNDCESINKEKEKEKEKEKQGQKQKQEQEQEQQQEQEQKKESFKATNLQNFFVKNEFIRFFVKIHYLANYYFWSSLKSSILGELILSHQVGEYIYSHTRGYLLLSEKDIQILNLTVVHVSLGSKDSCLGDLSRNNIIGQLFFQRPIIANNLAHFFREKGFLRTSYGQINEISSGKRGHFLFRGDRGVGVANTTQRIQGGFFYTLKILLKSMLIFYIMLALNCLFFKEVHTPIILYLFSQNLSINIKKIKWFGFNTRVLVFLCIGAGFFSLFKRIYTDVRLVYLMVQFVWNAEFFLLIFCRSKTSMRISGGCFLINSLLLIFYLIRYHITGFSYLLILASFLLQISIMILLFIFVEGKDFLKLQITPVRENWGLVPFSELIGNSESHYRLEKINTPLRFNIN